MSIGTLLRNTVTAGAAGVALCLAAASNASVLIPTGYYIDPPQSLARGGSNALPGGSNNAGAFKGTFDAVPIVFWCIELNEFFSFNTTYTNVYTAVPVNGVTPVSNYTNVSSIDFGRIGSLFTEAYGTLPGQALSDAAHSAAFQIALWNIVYDTDTSVSNGQGTFYITSGTPAALATIVIANTWLAGLGSTPDNFDTTWLRSTGPCTTATHPVCTHGHQDFVMGTRTSRFVPEPTPLLLIVAAMAAMMVARRRGGQTAV